MTRPNPTHGRNSTNDVQHHAGNGRLQDSAVLHVLASDLRPVP